MITVRQFDSDDWRAFRDLRLRALGESPGNFFRALADEEAAPDSRWIDLLSSDRQALFGLFDDDHLIGITGVFTDRDDPTTADFGMTWLDPAWRGRGLSAIYYRERIAWARSRGLARIVVSHRRSNETSRRAMLAAGFRETGADPHLWPDGQQDDDVHYEMVLT
ncbi:MAG: GNAT family N-acetyltransferase [Sphingomonas sp.]